MYFTNAFLKVRIDSTAYTNKHSRYGSGSGFTKGLTLAIF